MGHAGLTEFHFFPISRNQLHRKAREASLFIGQRPIQEGTRDHGEVMQR